MLGADVIVAVLPGFFGSEHKDAPAAFVQRQLERLHRSRGDQRPSSSARLIECDTPIMQNMRRKAVALAHESHQQVRDTNRWMLECARLVPGKLERLTRALGKPRKIMRRKNRFRYFQSTFELDWKLDLDQKRAC